MLYPHPGNSLTQSSHRDGEQGRFFDQSGNSLAGRMLDPGSADEAGRNKGSHSGVRLRPRGGGESAGAGEENGDAVVVESCLREGTMGRDGGDIEDRREMSEIRGDRGPRLRVGVMGDREQQCDLWWDRWNSFGSPGDRPWPSST